MSTLLEKHLHAACEAHESLKRLRNQWAYDRELIPKALQSIGSTFPHYSRHDQSHSDQILINIERILGPERISQLSATDTWLLLEAAYWHDIGMVVTHDALSQALQDKDFLSYVEDIAQNNNHELQKFAQHFKLKPHHAATAFSGATTPLEALEQFRYLMAEWFRQKHSKAAESIIIDPWKAAGISSPRTELIPQRLFLLLGQICSMHGENFDTVLSTMKYRETGQANDHCHPRFIACMLRLGDLLNIEDNRFCPVMQKIAGEQRPALSKAHEDKHKSLRHFRLDEERIEIEAVCAHVDGYVEQWNWLEYLEGELKQQMSRWSDIAPRKAFGLLPTLGEIKLSLKGNELIRKGERPQFKLDQSKVMALLKGDNLYGRYDMIRELIQNAVDATLIRAWLEAQRNGEPIKDKDTPDSEHVKEYLNKYPIKIEFNRITPKSSDGEQIEWELIIQDSGVGMDLEDLQFISSVGSSAKNKRKQAIIKQMPEWMRPSGVFGLGLQSAFMWAEEIRVSTRRYSADEGLEIVFHNPNNKKQGLIEIEKSPVVPAIGSKLSIKVLIEREQGVRLKENSLTATYWAQHDPLLDGGFNVDVYRMLDKIRTSTEHAPIPVDVSFDGEILPKKSKENQENELRHTVFLKSVNAYFGVKLRALSESTHRDKNVVRYRGQPVGRLATKDELEYVADNPFFSYTLDIWAGKADEWLTFDRSRLTALGVQKIKEMVERNLKQWVEINRSGLSQNNNHAIALSFLAHLRQSGTHDEDGFWTNIAKELPEKWLESRCFDSASATGAETLIDIFKNPENRCFSSVDYFGFENDVLDVVLTKPEFNSKSIYLIPDLELKLVLEHWLKAQPENSLHIYSLNPLVNEFDLLHVLFELARGEPDRKIKISRDVQVDLLVWGAFNNILKNRLLFPCFLLPQEIDQSKILLNEEVHVKGAISPFEILPENTLCCVLPFELPKRYHPSKNERISVDRLSEFIDWVMVNLADKTAKRSEVEAEYAKIIAYFNNDLMANNKRWQSAIKRPIQLTEKTESSENE